VQAAHADTARCTRIVSSSAWNGGTSVTDPNLFQVFSSSVRRN